MTAEEVAKKIVQVLDSKKASKVTLLKITDATIIADYFILATGNSNTQVRALSGEVEFQMKELGIEADHMEGFESGTWILMDFHDVIVHIFQPETRNFYDLERLWKDAQPVDISELVDPNE